MCWEATPPRAEPPTNPRIATCVPVWVAQPRVRRDEIADSIPCGPDLAPIVEAVSDAIEAGADHVYFHQVGDPLDGFVDLWDTELRGAVNELARSAT